MESEGVLKAPLELIWHHIGSQTPPEPIFGGIRMDLDSVLGGKIDQKLINIFICFLTSIFECILDGFFMNFDGFWIYF